MMIGPNASIVTTPRKILSVIFTFNRPAYLSNLVESHLALAPEIQLVIIDDASTDPLQIQALQSLKEKKGVEVLFGGGAHSRHGGLYSNMNMALELAANRGYRFLNLLQDDMQLVRPATDDMVLACNVLDDIRDGLHMSMTFRKYLDVRYEPKPCEIPLVYRSQNLQVADTGIIHVERAITSGFRFQGSEAAHSAAALQLGYKGFVYRDPVVAFVPWPIFFRNRKLHRGTLKRRVARMVPVAPMSAREIDALRQRDVVILPYHEEWCRPVNGYWISPYNYTSSRIEWLTRLAKHLFSANRSKRLLPRIVWPPK